MFVQKPEHVCLVGGTLTAVHGVMNGAGVSGRHVQAVTPRHAV